MAQQGKGKNKSKSRPTTPARPAKKKSRFRVGLLIGSALGYVLGTKAGRERYEQIRSLARRLSRSEPAQQLSGEARQAASRASEALEHKASEGVSRITDRVRGSTGGDDSG